MNIGRAKIWRSTLSLAVKTNLREYHTTVVNDIGILPSGTVYTSVSVPYHDSTETIAPSGSGVQKGARVIDAFYE